MGDKLAANEQDIDYSYIFRQVVEKGIVAGMLR